jgi:hypothetical protein
MEFFPAATGEAGFEAFQFFLNGLGLAMVNWRGAAAAAAA